MAKSQKNFDDVSDILSDQIDALSGVHVTQEQRKNAQAISRIVGVYVSLSVHKREYDMNKKPEEPIIPAFEGRNARGA